MDVHITEMYKAYAKFTNTLATMLRHFRESGGKQTEATKAAMEELNNQRSIFLVACDNADDFVQHTIKQVEEMEIVAYQTKMLDPSTITLKGPGQQIEISPTIESAPRMPFSVLGYKKCFDWEKEMVSDVRGGVGGDFPAESLDTATSGTKKI